MNTTLRTLRRFSPLSLLSLLACLSACSSGSEGGDVKSDQSDPADSLALVKDDEFTAADDREPSLPRERLKLQQADLEPVSDRPATPWSAFSREELALALRPRIIDASGSYVAASPAWAAADELLSPRRGKSAPEVIRYQGAQANSDSEQGESASPLIIGDDGRRLPAFGTTFTPWTFIARLVIEFAGSATQCTGSYIGPTTVITSAHCVLNPGPSRARAITFERARQGATLPFGRQRCDNFDVSRTNDFRMGIPAGYTGSHIDNADSPLDFAVIDVSRCHTSADFYGGFAIDPDDAVYWTGGYPGGRCPGATADGIFICAMNGPAYDNEWRLESEHLDVTGGQSGSPWWRQFDVFGTGVRDFPVGVLQGERTYFDLGRCGFDVCRRNFAHRLNAADRTLIQTTSVDF